MKIKHIILTLLSCIFLFNPIFTQENKDVPNKHKESSLWDRMYVGGNLGLQFGTVTDIEVSPHLGYYIYPRWSAGIGITYEYYNSKPYSTYYYSTKRIDTHIYGWSLFTRLALIPDLGRTFGFGDGISLIGECEYERLSLEKKFFEVLNTGEDGRFWIDSFLVGGGIKQAMGQRSSVYLLVMWDLNNTINSPYSNPIFKFGFEF